MPEATFLRLSNVALQPNRRIAVDSQAYPVMTEAIRPNLLFPYTPSSVPEHEAPFPISPQPAPADTVIYRDGKDPSKTFFLQRYRLRNSQGRYEISLNPESDGLWSVKFGLETYPAPEVAEAARTSQPLPHKLDGSLRYFMTGTSIEKSFPAFAVTLDSGGVVIEFRLTLEERDAVLRAFRSDAAQACLVVTRQVEVCIPAPPEPGERKKIALVI